MTAAERPATGATDADIEAAVSRCVASNEWLVGREEIAREFLTMDASYLVPPGSVIAPAEHVTDAADRAAIGRAHYAMTQVLSQRDNDFYGITPEHLARLERLSGEGERE